MKYRRCGSLLLEPRETVQFDLPSVLQGGGGVVVQQRWLALAPHLVEPVELAMEEIAQLGMFSPTRWQSGPLNDVQGRLLRKGLIVEQDAADGTPGDRDARLRRGHWWTPAAVMHWLGRWRGVDSAADMQANGLFSAIDLRGKLGAPPPAVVDRGDPAAIIPLSQRPAADIVASATRTTCRNFDPARALSADMLSRLLAATFMAHGQARAADDLQFLKKAVPSGGGLHATEAYLLVQAVQGVAPGLYHYRPMEHGLAPLQCDASDLGALAGRLVAGQHWFANAPVLLVLAPRYERGFWKYRNHAKAYRALLLDIGHLSQALYTQATSLGLGAFVTSAINELDVESAFGLDGVSESALAICGVGWRSARMENPELDPACAVWQKKGTEGIKRT